MIIANNGKNPNELHDFLITNDCTPIALFHNAVYDVDLGVKTQEATEIQIEIEPEKEQLLNQLVTDFVTL